MFPHNVPAIPTKLRCAKNHPPPPATHAVHPTAGQEKMNFHHEQTHTADDPKGRIETTKDCNCLWSPYFWKVQNPVSVIQIFIDRDTQTINTTYVVAYEMCKLKKIERVANSETGYNSLARLFPIELHLLNLSPGWIDQCNNDYYYTLAFHRKRPSPASV